MKYPDDFDQLLVTDRIGFARLSRPTQIAYCIHQLEAQVNNRGFHQYFFNSSGAYVRETLVALTEIGATATQALLQQAVKIAYPDGYPDDAEQHQEALAESDDTFDLLESLDQQFNSYMEPLPDLVNANLARKS